MNEIVTIIFSKNRAMQLRALLESFFLHCQNVQLTDVVVLYKTTEEGFDNQYAVLEKEFENVDFVRETNLVNQVLTVMYYRKYVVFFVDDSMVVRSFDIQKIIRSLAVNRDAIGFSLRLGDNTTYSYMNRHKKQSLPVFIGVENNIYKYNWIDEEYDFGYPLEISSSVYDVNDFCKMRFIPEVTPNQFEGHINTRKGKFKKTHPYLLCFKKSVVFSVPVNKVNESNNPSGRRFCYSVQMLAEKFDQGYKIDIEKFVGFLPDSVHQEVKLEFVKEVEQ